jgi:hypothetical protein
MSGGGRGAEKLQCEGQWRKEGGFLPLGMMAYIDDDKGRPAWGQGRSVRPPVVSWLGRDGAAHWVAREACAERLTGGDLGRFK